MRKSALIALLLISPGLALAEPDKSKSPAEGEKTKASAPTAAPPSGSAVAAPAVPSDPVTTTASFGDWVLVCQKLGDAERKRACEVSQSVQVQGQPGPIAQMAIAKDKQGAARLTVVLPNNIIFAAKPKISVDEKDAQPVEVDWVKCIPGGCIGDGAVKDEALTNWRAQTDRGRLEFKDATGRSIIIPFSFRGLPQALDALAKEQN